MTVCKHVYYTGRVQGVGFRYAAQRIAGRFKVTGYVRNLSNGEVELVAEGEPTDVTYLLAAVAERMAGYIDQVREHDEPSGGYCDFDIRS